jgi:hypothetical protein
VVDFFKDENITYVRTDKPLSMADNWEFALSKATGDYITFLTDACYLFPTAISVAMEELEKFRAKLAVWKNCSYFYPDWIESERKNSLYIPNVTGQSFILDSKEVLKKCFDNVRAHASIMPRSMNSLCHRSVIDKIISIQGRFCMPLSPYYSSGIAVLLNTENYVLIDQLLYIGSISHANTGANAAFTFGKVFQDFYKESDYKLNEMAFLGIPAGPAIVARNFEKIRMFYKDTCPELNIKNVLCEIVDSFSKLEAYGAKAKIDDYWQIFDKYVATQANKIKFAVAKQKVKSKIKWRAVKIIRSSPYLYWLESLRNVQILKGSKWKFNNIEECAKIVTFRNQTERDKLINKRSI